MQRGTAHDFWTSRHRHLVDAVMSCGTPLYLYSEELLEQNLGEITGGVDASTVYFATMANSNPWVLSRVIEVGAGLLVPSLRHADLAARLGAPLDLKQARSEPLLA